MVRVTAHSIVNIATHEGAIGASVPFLFLRNGDTMVLALAWARELTRLGFSPSKLNKAIAALGYFYDYYIIELKERVLARHELPIVLQKFFEARRHGHKGLGWKPVTPLTALADVTSITAFSAWCTANFDTVAINPAEKRIAAELNYSEQTALRIAGRQRQNWDQLFHLYPATEGGRGYVSKRRVNPRAKKSKVISQKKYFPPYRVMDLIRDCARRSPRDALYLLLLFFGGLRPSEPLHLFVTDVIIQQDGQAKVILGHPQDGLYVWFDGHGARRRGNRATFLAERYGLGPRNRLYEGHPSHAGWKGMEMETKNQTEVYWSRPDAARLFARLHVAYMKRTRAHLRDEHPYYFVNEKPGEDYGNPVTMSNITKIFNRAVQRIGLSTSEDGVNPNGGRHFYGYYCASVLRLSMETTQMHMHHGSITSTRVYYSLTIEAAREELLKAHKRIESELPPMLKADSLLLV